LSELWSKDGGRKKMTLSECISLLELLKKEMQFDPCNGDKEILEIQALDEAIETLRFYSRFFPAEQAKSLHDIEVLDKKIKEACRVKWHGAPYLDDR
jgi:hypothetical protein